jgi:hypothetical protein
LPSAVPELVGRRRDVEAEHHPALVVLGNVAVNSTHDSVLHLCVKRRVSEDPATSVEAACLFNPATNAALMVRLTISVEHMPPNNGHAGGAQSAEEANRIEKRRTEVAFLMMAHFTYREMAEKLGVAPATISEDVKAIREEWRQRSSADYGSYLAEELAKLDLLEREVGTMALSGGPEGGVNLAAVDRLLAIRDRRARMLGLDSPSRVEVTMRVEQIAKALIAVVSEMGLNVDEVRPLLGAKLRELDAISEN